MSTTDFSIKPPRSVKTKLNPNGRIVIPAAIREELGLQPGETLLMDVEDGTIRIESYRTRVRRIQESLAHLRKPGILASDELIAERREEARMEMEELERDKARWRAMEEEGLLKDGTLG